MSKKSAASKGYRKTKKERPFLTKKEIIAVVAIVLAIVLAVILFNLFYDDGYLSASEVQDGDIVAYANQDVKSRYAKLGVANELEGFTRTAQNATNNKLVSYYYSPDAEIDQINFISINGSVSSADSLANSVLSNYASSGVDASELHETTIQGYDAYIFAANVSSYDPDLDTDAQDDSAEADGSSEAEAAEPASGETAETEATEPASGETAETEAAEPLTGEATETEATEPASGETAETEENAPNSFSQSVSCYVAVDDTHTLCFHIYRVGEDESLYLSDDQLVDFVLSYADAFTLVEPNA